MHTEYFVSFEESYGALRYHVRLLTAGLSQISASSKSFVQSQHGMASQQRATPEEGKSLGFPLGFSVVLRTVRV